MKSSNVRNAATLLGMYEDLKYIVKGLKEEKSLGVTINGQYHDRLAELCRPVVIKEYERLIKETTDQLVRLGVEIE